MAKEKKPKPEDIARDLLKLLAENAKPIIRKSGANTFEVKVAGKTVKFTTASKPAGKRKDIS